MRVGSLGFGCALVLGWAIAAAQDSPARGSDNDGEPRTSRFTFAPAVTAILAADTPEGSLARIWLRYQYGLVGEAGVRLEDVVAPDVQCIELEAAGYPPRLAGFQVFRQQINTAFPDESVFVAELRFTGVGIVEAELHATGTHRGELLGRPATNRRYWFAMRTLNRFRGNRMVQRWDRMDFAALLAQIDAATGEQSQ